MNNWEMATDATNTAINSQGSAMKEQEKYAESLEGRLNRLDTAWNKFTLSVGDAILTDSFIGVVEGLNGIASGFAKVIETIGFLPTALTVAIGGISLFSKNMRELSSKFASLALSIPATTGSLSGLGKNMEYVGKHSRTTTVAVDGAGQAITRSARHATAGAIAMKGFTAAIRGIATATVVGAALMAVGMAIEFVIKKISDSREAAKEMQEGIDRSIDALTVNKDKVDNLIATMQQYEGQDIGSLDSTSQEEFLSAQNQLLEIYPEVISRIDSAGFAHLKTAEEIKKQKDATLELIEAQRQADILDSSNKVKEAQKKAEDIKREAESLKRKKKDQVQTGLMSDSSFSGVDKYNDAQKAQIDVDALKKTQEYAAKLKEVNGAILDMVGNINAINNTKISSEIGNEIERIVQSMNLKDFNPENTEAFSKEISKLSEELQKAQDIGDTTMIQEALNKLNDLSVKHGGAKVTLDEFNKSVEKSNSTLEKNTMVLDENGEAYEDASSAYADALAQTEAAIAGLSGVTVEHVKLTDNLLYLYESYANQISLVSDKEMQSILNKVELANSTDTLSASEKYLYDAYQNTEMTYERLLSMYPELVKSQEFVNMSKQDAIKWIEQEALANDQYLAALEMSRNGQLTAEEDKSLNLLKETNKRIDIINAEITALANLSAAYQAYQKSVEAAKNSEDPELAARAGLSAMRTSMLPGFADTAEQINAKMAEKAKIIAGDQAKYRREIARIDGINANANTRAGKAAEKLAKANEKAAKAAEKNAKAIETQIKAYDLFSYAADKYANAQNKINASMAKYDLILKKFPKHTKEYRQALKEQADLLQKQRKLVNSQYKDIEGQIASGVFKPVGVFADGQVLGVITTSSANASSNLGGGSVSSSMASGNSNEAKAWNFFKSQGFNDNAVAGILGNLKQESNLNPNAKQYGGGPGRGIAQWSVGGRWDQLVKWAKANKKNEWDLQTQLEYLLLEINGSGNVDKTGFQLLNKKFGGMAGFKNSANVETAMKIFEKSYERAGKPNYDNRLKYANQYKQQYGGVSVAGAGGDTFSGSLGKATGVIGYAQQFVGKVPYVFGGNSLASGIDCSAFVQQIIKKTTGYNLPRTTAGQVKHGTAVNKSNIQAGDLVFFQGTYRSGVSHVVISMGGTKGIGAQSSGGVGVIDFGTGYWAKHYMTAKRLNYSSSKNPSTGISYSGNPGGASVGGASAGSNVISDTTAQAQAISDMSKDKANLAQMTDQAKQDLLKLKTDLYGVDGQLEDIRHEIIMSYTYEFDKKISDKDVTAQKYQNLTYWLDKNSQAYRNNILNQRKALIQKQDLIAAEEAAIRHLMKTTQMSAATRYELEQKLNELNNDKIANAEKRDALNWEIITSSMAEYQEQIEKTTRSLDRLRSLRDRLDSGTKEYRESLRQEAEGLKDVNKALMEQMNTMERQSYYYKLTAEQERERQKMMSDAADQIIANNNAIESIQKELVDKIIEAARKGYEQRRDIEVKRVEESVRLAEEESNKKIKAIQKEADEYEKAIRRKIEAINSQYEEDQYLKNLRKMQEEERRIQNLINRLALSDAQEDIAKRVALEKELKDIREQIEDETTRHSIDKQVEALEKELEKNQETVDDKIKSEEDKMDEVRKNSEKEIKEINWKYNEILNDEKKWNDLRTALLKGQTDEMMGILNEHLTGLKNFGEDTMKQLEISYTGLLSILQNIRDAGQDLGVVSDLEDIINNSPHKDENFQAKNEAWNKYLSNKRKYDRPETTAKEKEQLAKENAQLRKDWGFIDGHWRDLEKLDINSIDKDPARQERLLAWNEYIKNKEAYANSTNSATSAQLRERNAYLRNKYNFPDAPLNVLKSLDSDLISEGTDDKTAEKVRDWMKYLTNKRVYKDAKTTAEQKKLQEENAKLRAKWSFPDGTIEYLSSLDPLKFHDGGIVGDKSSKLGELLNKFFNTSPNEQVIKSLKGELQVPPKNFTNVVGGIQALASSMAGDRQSVIVEEGLKVFVDIGEFHGTKENADYFSDSLTSKLKKMGRF